MSALIEKFRFAGDSALEGDGFRTFGPAVQEGFPRPATRASAPTQPAVVENATITWRGENGGFRG